MLTALRPIRAERTVAPKEIAVCSFCCFACSFSLSTDICARRIVITSYSIHYTKLYEPPKTLREAVFSPLTEFLSRRKAVALLLLIVLV